MPELDPDLVTWLTLGLLGLIVICLLGVMSSIGRVRRAIERAAAQREREREDRWQSTSAAAAAPVAAAAEPEPAIERRPEPVAAKQPEPASQTHSSEEPVSTTSSDGGPGVVATESASTGAGESPSSQSSEQAAAQPAAASTSSSEQAAQEPQEQPFERDGRWWFRRGSELLVYDESTGQWITAPGTANRGAATATQQIPTTISSVAGTGEHAAEGGAEQHGFWKCPSCGAVNGSTATSCRMCFTARP